MEEVEKIQSDGRKGGSTAFIGAEGSLYNITYFIPIQEAIRVLASNTEPQNTINTDPPSIEKKENISLLNENRELLLEPNTFDLSPKALSHLDNNKYKISYYVKLSDYHREKQEYDQKMQRYEAGDKEVFQEKADPLIFYSKETPEMSAEALSEMDGRKYKMSYYMEMEKYYRDTREYDEKMIRFKSGDEKAFEVKREPVVYSKDTPELSASALSELDGKRYKMSYYTELEKYNRELKEYDEALMRYNSGDKEAFEKQMDPMMFYSKDSVDLSSKALSESDGKKYKMSYYEKLRAYQKEREDYEKKLLLYHSGEKDIFEKKETEPVINDAYSLSAEALSYADGKKYKMSYYEELKKYYDDIQDYNRKMALHNAGDEDAFKEEASPPVLSSKDTSALSAKALSELDGKKHKMSYYKKLENYYKELEEYEQKKILYDKGAYKVDEESEGETISTSDKVEIDFNTGNQKKKKSKKTWTPEFEDMVAAMKGRVAPFFMDNLFSALSDVDGEFERKFAAPMIRVYMDCSTEITPEEELLRELEKVAFG